MGSVYRGIVAFSVPFHTLPVEIKVKHDCPWKHRTHSENRRLGLIESLYMQHYSLKTVLPLPMLPTEDYCLSIRVHSRLQCLFIHSLLKAALLLHMASTENCIASSYVFHWTALPQYMLSTEGCIASLYAVH